MKKLICAALAAVMALGVFGCAPKVHVENSAKDGDFAAYSWPDNELSSVIPQLKGDKSFVQTNDSDRLTVWVKPCSESDFNSYVDKCKEAGFKESGVSVGSTVYTAENAAGYSVDVIYDSSTQSISVTVDAPSSGTSSSGNSSSSSAAGKQPDDTDIVIDMSGDGKQPDDKDFVFNMD